MAARAEVTDRTVRRPDLLRRILLAAAGLGFVGAGLLLWSRTGDAVFSDLVLSALAWCF